MKIKNITMNGTGKRKYFWYYLIEIFCLFFGEIEMDGVTIKNFSVTEKDCGGFELARFIKKQIEDSKVLVSQEDKKEVG